MKNNSRLISILTICIAATAALVLSVYGAAGAKLAEAQSAGANVSGWAWSSAVGWISFNCSNTNTCGTVQYGVNINETTGAITGYAWSSHIGWISFNETIGCPTTCGAYVENVTPSTMTGYKPVKGWAKVLGGGTPVSGGWSGWIRLDHGLANPVTYSFQDRVFKGYAWGGPLVVGWVSFNSSDTASPFAYSVTGPGLSTPSLRPLGPVQTAPDCDASNASYLRIFADTNLNTGPDISYAMYPVSFAGVVGAAMYGSQYGTNIVFKDYSATSSVSKRYAIYARSVSTGASTSTATSSLQTMPAGYSCGSDPNIGSKFTNKRFFLDPTMVIPPATCTGTWNVTHDGNPAEVEATCFMQTNKDAPNMIVLSGSAPFVVGTHKLTCNLRNITEPDIVYETLSISRRCLRNAELIER